MSFLNREIECMPREELKKIQSERLCQTVRHCYENVECFRNRMKEKGLTPDDIHGIEDIHLLPFSYKKDLREFYYFSRLILRLVPSTSYQSIVAYNFD